MGWLGVPPSLVAASATALSVKLTLEEVAGFLRLEVLLPEKPSILKVLDSHAVGAGAGGKFREDPLVVRGVF